MLLRHFLSSFSTDKADLVGPRWRITVVAIVDVFNGLNECDAVSILQGASVIDTCSTFHRLVPCRLLH
jgi:hypothetical protein